MSNPVQRERKAFQMELRRLLPGRKPLEAKHSGTIRISNKGKK